MSRNAWFAVPRRAILLMHAFACHRFVVADLKKVDRSKTPWVIVVRDLIQKQAALHQKSDRHFYIRHWELQTTKMRRGSLRECRVCVCCVQGFHRPIYTTSLEGVTLASDLVVASDLRDAYEQIFYQYEVCCSTCSTLVQQSHQDCYL